MIDGKAISWEIRNELKGKITNLKEQGIIPGLAIILVGNHSASEVYVRGKMKASKEVGIKGVLIRFREDVSERELLDQIIRLNQDASIHGILVQLPLPKHISTRNVVETISHMKDVDGFHPYNVGRCTIGYESFVPCTPRGIMELLRRSAIDIAGRHAVVIGRSNIVGKPIATLLQQAHATVTMCHSRTVDLSVHTQQADILIVAVGQGKLITAEHVKTGAVVIDVGMNRDEHGKLVGDVDFEAVAPLVGAITPVPGGVGPMTIAMLLSNTVWAAKRFFEDQTIFLKKR